jgi:hypothetical protein
LLLFQQPLIVKEAPQVGFELRTQASYQASRPTVPSPVERETPALITLAIEKAGDRIQLIADWLREHLSTLLDRGYGIYDLHFPTLEVGRTSKVDYHIT